MSKARANGIRVEKLTYTYDEGNRPVAVFHELDCHFANAETIAILGRSGSGKTTLLRLLCGLTRPRAGGRVLIDGQPADQSVRQRMLGYLPQDAQPAPWRTVLKNLTLPLELTGYGGDEVALAEEMLDNIGIAHLAHRYPAEVSGGERRRTMIAMSIVHKPRYILLDEPFGSLDYTTRTEMYGFLDRVRMACWGSNGSSRSGAVLLVTHDLEEAAILGDTVFIVTMGATRSLKLFGNPIASDRRKLDFQALRGNKEFRDFTRELQGAL